MTLQEIASICGGTLSGKGNIEVSSYSTDTRTLRAGALYIPLKGEKFDGHKFIGTAFKKGAVAALSTELRPNSKYPIIHVSDTLKALQALSAALRASLSVPVVAITGSVGKTSTKDLIGAVVTSKYKTLKTEDNFNNDIGLPLTMLRYQDEEAMVLEMGMNHLGEISLLANLANPDIAVITNIGSAHIGNLGSFENILKAKLEITENFTKDNILIINTDNHWLNKFYQENKPIYKIKTIGIRSDADVKATDIDLRKDGSSFNYNGYRFNLNVAGEHFIFNALSAIAVGESLNIPYEKMQEAISNFKLTRGRMDVIHLKNNIDLIDGSYNANFDSMKSSIEVLGKYKNKRTVAVLADMLELGAYSKQLHNKVGEVINSNKIDVLYCVGNESLNIFKGARNHKNKIWFKNNEYLIDELKHTLQPNDIVLVKGSNAMNLKEVVNFLKEM